MNDNAQPVLPADSKPRIATLISEDRVPVTLYEKEDGGLTILIGGRQPVDLDRWQYAALRGALAERG